MNMYVCMIKTLDCFNGADRAIFSVIFIFALIRTSSALCIVSFYRTVNAGFHSKRQSVNVGQGNNGYLL
jgi:hypothetical protein